MLGGTAMLRGQQAQALASQGRLADALALVEAAPASEREALMSMRLGLAKALDLPETVVAVRRAQVAKAPDSMVAHHNLAGALGDLGLMAEAEAEARKAFALGGDAPETWLVLARALQGQGRWDEAQDGFQQVLNRRSDYVVAASELSQLIWMSGGDAAQARAPLLALLERHPAHPNAIEALAILNSYLGLSDAQVHADLVGQLGSVDPVPASAQILATNLAVSFDAELAVRHGQQASQQNSNDPMAWATYAKALLVAGRTQEAADILAGLTGLANNDQTPLALHATAMRVLGSGDPLGLDDAENLIRAATIDTPAGWDSLGAYLADLKTALEQQHSFVRHPVGQSLRHGTQTPVDLRRVDCPVIKAFFGAIDGPIKRHLAALGTGPDPIRKRNTGNYRFAGCWSVRLGSGGFHESHIHPKGWLSSACYIDLPDAVGRGGHEGWIGFGVPPFDLPVPLQHLKLEKPEPGKLVLFPSCMWHGTIPFTDERPRLTIAFDLLPA